MGPWQERYIWVCPVCLGDNVFDIAGVQEVSPVLTIRLPNSVQSLGCAVTKGLGVL